MPSYDVETRILNSDADAGFETFSAIALAMVIFFTIMEGIELQSIGPVEYFQDVWNVMDWANYLVYFMVYAQVRNA